MKDFEELTVEPFTIKRTGSKEEDFVRIISIQLICDEVSIMGFVFKFTKSTQRYLEQMLYESTPAPVYSATVLLSTVGGVPTLIKADIEHHQMYETEL